MIWPTMGIVGAGIGVLGAIAAARGRRFGRAAAKSPLSSNAAPTTCQ
jgi:hypothetical protein